MEWWIVDLHLHQTMFLLDSHHLSLFGQNYSHHLVEYMVHGETVQNQMLQLGQRMVSGGMVWVDMVQLV